MVMQRSARTIILLAFLLLYIVSPLDVIPDMLGPLGRLDDLLVVALVAWRYYSQGPGRTGSSSSDTRNKPKSEKSPKATPYQVLDLPPNASPHEVEERYKSLMKQYHPDKVAHLGEDLRRLAHEKTIEIQQAYQTLVSRG